MTSLTLDRACDSCAVAIPARAPSWWNPQSGQVVCVVCEEASRGAELVIASVYRPLPDRSALFDRVTAEVPAELRQLDADLQVELAPPDGPAYADTWPNAVSVPTTAMAPPVAAARSTEPPIPSLGAPELPAPVLVAAGFDAPHPQPDMHLAPPAVAGVAAQPAESAEPVALLSGAPAPLPSTFTSPAPVGSSAALTPPSLTAPAQIRQPLGTSEASEPAMASPVPIAPGPGDAAPTAPAGPAVASPDSAPVSASPAVSLAPDSAPTGSHDPHSEHTPVVDLDSVGRPLLDRAGLYANRGVRHVALFDRVDRSKRRRIPEMIVASNGVWIVHHIADHGPAEVRSSTRRKKTTESLYIDGSNASKLARATAWTVGVVGEALRQCADEIGVPEIGVERIICIGSDTGLDTERMVGFEGSSVLSAEGLSRLLQSPGEFDQRQVEAIAVRLGGHFPTKR